MVERRLEGRVALVTGASRGLGQAVADRLAEEGARVIVNYASGAEAAEAVVAGIRRRGGEAICVQADVSSAADVERLVATTLRAWGRIDILVNNAGIEIARDFLETTEDDWDRTIDVNLKGAWLCSKAVAPVMLEQKAGRIIMMSSNSGLYHPSAMMFAEYVTSKAGMNGLTKALALRLGPHITVNAVCPGFIETAMTRERGSAFHQRVLAETPLERFGTPEDVAASVAFLASDDAAFITGETLLVAGGRGMH